MRLISASANNFGSYEEISIDFNKGLCLISGPTGSGKSTICDLVPWVLFGRTAKGGAVDDIISWTSKGATGSAVIQVGPDRLTVWRSRKPNDLYYTIDGETFRGKDLVDTQSLLNQYLNCDLDLYLSGAYFHEFSQTAQFFTTTAKIRRSITDQLADLRLATLLNAKSSTYKKDLSAIEATFMKDLEKSADKLEYLVNSLDEMKSNQAEWESSRRDRISHFQELSSTFDEDKINKIQEIKKAHLERRVEMEYELGELEKSILPESYFKETRESLNAREFDCDDVKCPECGALKDNTKRLAIVKDRYALDRTEAENNQKNIQRIRQSNLLRKHNESLERLLANENSRVNTYIDQIASIKEEKNPYRQPITSSLENIETLKSKIVEINQDLSTCRIESGDVELLQEVVQNFRSSVVKNTIVELEMETNNILSTYFDGELKVTFDIAEADKLEVAIYKDGNICNFTQLSKGQRQLLKLSFALSVMRCVRERHTLDFNTIFLDEFCEGLSEELKIKTFKLLQYLSQSYENVFVVEHSQELKNLFDNRIEVELIDGRSHIG